MKDRTEYVKVDFKGTVTVPTGDEDVARELVTRSLEKFCKEYDIWDEELSKEPTCVIWPRGEDA